jgi:uncharacterized protein YgiM (DUF1202 family)
LGLASCFYPVLYFTSTPACAGSLKDIRGHWAAAEIEQALTAGYVSGYPDGSFKPNAAVTRAELAVMVVQAFHLAGGQPAGGQNNHVFKDVSARDWFAPAVNAALADGIVSGYPDGTFRPRKSVNRQEAACMLAGLLNLNTATASLNFTDKSQVASWAISSVSMLNAQGIIAGYPDGAFKPGKVISRAEAVVLIAKALAYEFTPVSDQLQVTDDIVNVRSGPSQNTQRIGQVHKGDILQASQRGKDNWYQVAFQGGTGWIAGWCVTVCQPGQAPAQPISPGSNQTPTGPVLNVQVKQGATGTTVDITGAQGAYQYTEQTNPQRLLVTAPGIANIQSSPEIDVGAGGIDKIITTFAGAVPGPCQVAVSFAAAAAPLTYNVAPGAAGELLITLPPQIYQVQAVPISDFVAVSVQGTAPLSFQPSQSGSRQFNFDIAGCLLNSSLQSWQQQVNTSGVNSIQLGYHQSGTVRLTVNAAPDVFYTSGTSADGTQLILWFQEPAAKKALLSAPKSGALYYGMDTSPYPGDGVMQAWWNNSPFCYTGFYLGPTPYHPESSFMDKRQVLVNQGWGLLPIYVGRQADSDFLNAANGRADADNAVTLAVSAGFAPGTTIYLDVETPLPLTGAYMNYVTAWVHELQSKGFSAGIYCNTKNASQISSALTGSVAFWVAHYIGDSLPTAALSPAADTGVAFATTWQFTGDSSLSYGGYPLSVDLDVSTSRDPSMSSAALTNISLY